MDYRSLLLAGGLALGGLESRAEISPVYVPDKKQNAVISEERYSEREMIDYKNWGTVVMLAAGSLMTWYGARGREETSE